jgi:hypothetical protein
MSAPPQVPDPAADHRGPAFWLPPNGFGNGIDAEAWAEIADLTKNELPGVLRALTRVNIGAYAAPLRKGTRGPGSTGATYRLWVDTLRYLSAEDVLMLVLRSRGARSASSG